MKILLVIEIFIVFDCTYARVYGDHLTQGHGTVGQLYKVLNTSDPVWMLKRSYTNDDRQCVYTLKKSLNNFDYNFLYVYADSKGLQKEQLYARLDAATGVIDGIEGAKFTVYKRKGEKVGTPYILLHWEDKHHCAILYSKENGSTKAKCEAHIWNQDLATGKEECLKLYATYCPLHLRANEQPVYNNECRVDPGC